MKTYLLCALVCFLALKFVVQAEENSEDTHFSRQDRDFRPLQFGKRNDGDFRPLQFGKKDASFRPLQFGKRASNLFNGFRLADPRIPSARQWQFVYPNLVNN